MATKRKPAKRIGQKAILRSTKQAVDNLFQAVAKPKSNRAYDQALKAITELGTLANLFEEAAARKYRVIRLGHRSGKTSIFAQKARA
jgi:hypothetical protein